ncbi:BMC domain-containing protein [Enterococcus mundtii]|uniref:Microcompartment protein family n=1 Tax=Enterococcus mundtii TaxID=53346 RepID=A0AAI8R872_ENTMU|nr:BMC domain-containing protein [Enterococcus mundtii]MCA6773144.1 BMC domain-containing protein [Enterococcus mundtii]MDY4306965.1 BMC domain-containing protein [Enterococcus mundtii]QCJ57153.1 BMC domain-containing protein [Enterococcus mundtii]BAO07763.1 microcompartment protein family [Enterococcus mundtii QU 25]BBM14097.1 microcompartment protein family [Enterococcus mundtii]
MNAIGMIEVRGFLGAVSVSDAALKSADVTLLNAEIIKGGLTTVQLSGDVAAVNAAVDAGVVVAKALNCLISHHVISRVDEQTHILFQQPKTEEPAEPTKVETKVEATQISETNDRRAELQAKRVAELRKEAYKLNVKHLKPSEIKSASKQSLVEAIMAEIKGVTHRG